MDIRAFLGPPVSKRVQDVRPPTTASESSAGSTLGCVASKTNLPLSKGKKTAQPAIAELRAGAVELVDDAPKPKPKGHPWFQFQERPDPPLKGQKPLPVGQAKCLSGKVFHITGVLDSLEREQAVELIQEYGGQVAKTLAKKVTHALVGLEASEKKEAIIAERKLPVLNEDDLFEMIKTLPEPKLVPVKTTPKKRTASKAPPLVVAKSESATTASFAGQNVVCATTSSDVSVHTFDVSPTPSSSGGRIPAKTLPKGAGSLSFRTLGVSEENEPPKSTSLLWPDKWRPRSVQEILGNGAAIGRFGCGDFQVNLR